MSYGFCFGTEVVGEEEIPVDFGTKWSVIVLDSFQPPSTTPGVGVAVPMPDGSSRFYRTTRDVIAVEFPVEYPTANDASIVAALTSSEGLPLAFAGYAWGAAIWDGGPLARIVYPHGTTETTIRFLV